MGATDLETRMQKYCGEAREGGYKAMYFHAMIDGRSGGGQRLKSWLKGKAMAKLIQAYDKGYSRQKMVVRWLFR